MVQYYYTSIYIFDVVVVVVRAVTSSSSSSSYYYYYHYCLHVSKLHLGFAKEPETIPEAVHPVKGLSWRRVVIRLKKKERKDKWEITGPKQINGKGEN